jgi:hypothetical protein
MLIDQNIRRLVGQHFHIVRKFGMQKAVVHEWGQVNPDPTKTRAGSIRHDYSYNKDVYNWYKSAEVHTVKRNIPLRYYFMFLAPLLIISLLYIAYTKLDPKRSRLNPANNPVIASKTESGQVNKVVPKLDYFEDHRPRIPGLPHTAPIYDKVTEPTIAPLPAACVLIRKKCTCYTQQATRLDTDDDTCRQIVQNGYFIDHEQHLQTLDRPIAHDQEQAGKNGYANTSTEEPAPNDQGVASVQADQQDRTPPYKARELMAKSKWAYRNPS